MCKGFGCIVTAESVYFIEPDFDGDVSHSEIIKRLGWEENKDPFNRRFIRVEYPDWTAASFRVDENGTLPGWVDVHDVNTRCDAVLSKVATALAEYEKVRATALAEYDKVCATAWAEYVKVCDAAWAEFVTAMSKVTGYVPDKSKPAE